MFSADCTFSADCMFSAGCMFTEDCMFSEDCMFTEDCMFSADCMFTADCIFSAFSHFSQQIPHFRTNSTLIGIFLVELEASEHKKKLQQVKTEKNIKLKQTSGIIEHKF